MRDEGCEPFWNAAAFSVGGGKDSERRDCVLLHLGTVRLLLGTLFDCPVCERLTTQALLRPICVGTPFGLNLTLMLFLVRR